MYNKFLNEWLGESHSAKIWSAILITLWVASSFFLLVTFIIGIVDDMDAGAIFTIGWLMLIYWGVLLAGLADAIDLFWKIKKQYVQIKS